MKIYEVVLLAESANTLFAVQVIDPKTGDEKTMEISALTATEAKSKVAGRTVDVDGEKKHYKVISVKSAWNEAKDVGKQLSVEQLATISDAALDSAYGYGRSQPGNTFGWQANLKSAAFAKQMIDKGVTDVEAISDAIHKGWNVTAQAFVKNPQMFDDSKTMAPEKLQAKIAQRQKLMTQQYAQLPEDEKEKDRVVAHAMLQAITGGQQGVEEEKAGLYANTHAKRERIKHGSGEHMRKPGTKGAPTSQSWKDAAKTAKTEAANPAQQAATAIAMKNAGKKPKHSEKEMEEANYKGWVSNPQANLASRFAHDPDRAATVYKANKYDPKTGLGGYIAPRGATLDDPNIQMQLYRNLDSTKSKPLKFKDGSILVINPKMARQALSKIESMRPVDKHEAVKSIMGSKDAFIAFVKQQGVKEGETGPKFTGYWKGKNKGKPGNKMVGDA